MIKDIPILMSAPMVRAILGGTKTMTRRTSDRWEKAMPGDHLLVREEWGVHRDFDNIYDRCKCVGRGFIHYRADEISCPVKKWRRSLFMPKWASRITLELFAKRREHLQDITEVDAIKEGVGSGFQMNGGWPDYQHINKSGICEATQDTARMSYVTLFESINGPGSWNLNPLLWVLEFKRIK